MTSDPFPKLLVNREGERLYVQDFFEQDAATAAGYFRARGRIADRQDAKTAKAAEAPDPEAA